MVAVQIARPLLSELVVKDVGVQLLSLDVVLVSVQMQIHEYPSHPFCTLMKRLFNIAQNFSF